MTTPSGPQATPADVRAVGEKLEIFYRELPPGEQAVLAWLMQQSAMSGSDDSLAQGYAIVLKRRPGRESDLPFEFEMTWTLGEQHG